MAFDSISLNLNAGWFYFVAGIAVAALFTYYMYKITIPPVNKGTKWFLISLRVLALIIILSLFFEPVFLLKTKKTETPKTFVFVDNSKSLATLESNKTLTEEFLEKFADEEIAKNSEIFLFGDSVRSVKPDDSFTIKDRTTNFLKIVEQIRESKSNIASVVIISDGIITDGVNPVNSAEKLSVPFFTLGLGDTSSKKDVLLGNIVYDNRILTSSVTPVLASVEQHSFTGQKSSVSLYEDNRLIGQKEILFSDDESQTLIFNYSPKSAGEKKLTLKVDPLEGETNKLNNSKTFYITVRENRNNVVLISPAPSADLTFIKNALKLDSTISINTITESGPGKYLEGSNFNSLLDSAKTLFLIGFPSASSSNDLVQKVSYLIKQKSVPFFLLLSNYTDFSKLKNFEAELPFSFSQGGYGSISSVQPSIPGNQVRNPLLQNSAANIENTWNSLPPVFKINWDIRSKPESEILSFSSINNVTIKVPLLLTREVASKKSIAVTAFDLWRWKLMRASTGSDLYDRFILNSQRWLTTVSDKKQVKIETSKRLYSAGEKITFYGEVFDKSFNPIGDAEVKVTIRSGSGKNYDLILNSLGNGLYSSSFAVREPGDYNFSGEAQVNGIQLGKDTGRFTISDQDLELINTTLDSGLLKLLAGRTGGKYFLNSDYSGLFPVLRDLYKSASKEVIKTSEFAPLSSLWPLMIVVLLFGIEWFIRKRLGLL